MDRFLLFEYEGAPWRSIGYRGLDDVLLKARTGDGEYEVLGSRKIVGKPVYFIGLNLFYHLWQTRDKEAQKPLAIFSAIIKKKVHQDSARIG